MNNKNKTGFPPGKLPLREDRSGALDRADSNPPSREHGGTIKFQQPPTPAPPKPKGK